MKKATSDLIFQAPLNNFLAVLKQTPTQIWPKFHWQLTFHNFSIILCLIFWTIETREIQDVGV